MLTTTEEREIDAAFSTLSQRLAGALLVGSDPFFGDRPNHLVELAARHAIPTMYFLREFVEADGLVSYGTSQADTYRQAGIYAGKILQGGKTADLPIMQAGK